MATFRVDPSQDSFGSYISRGNYYVDKSEMIYRYLSESFVSNILFTRPRRFGKTMIMTMFRCFLDNCQDSKDLFKGLKVMKYEDFVQQNMNKWPVVFLSFKDVKGANYEKVYEAFRGKIAEVFRYHSYLLGSDDLDEGDKRKFNSLKEEKESEGGTISGLAFLCEMLRKHHKKSVFVIIDEYDVPIASAVGSNSYDSICELIEKMLSSVCKTNFNVEAVMISGCLYTVGLNNIQPNSVLSNQYSDCFGFTEDEVQQVLSAAGLSDMFDEVRDWYDGYIFGKTHIYNPWDVMKYVKHAKEDGLDDLPLPFWLNTSEANEEMVKGFIGKTEDALESFEMLLSGKSITKVLNENVPYHRLHESGANLWTGLLETGYLTKATERGRRGTVSLRIPNMEIREVFRKEIWDFFENRVDIVKVTEFINALWSANVLAATSALDIILESTVSCFHAYHEYTYHLVLDGFFTGQICRVRSEFETGYGRSDLVVTDIARNRALVLELKHAENEGSLDASLVEACDQIKAKKYESSLVYDGYTYIRKYGMAFWNRRCLIQELK